VWRLKLTRIVPAQLFEPFSVDGKEASSVRWGVVRLAVVLPLLLLLLGNVALLRLKKTIVVKSDTKGNGSY